MDHSVWDRRCGDTGEESEGWISVCGTGVVVVILVKRARDRSQTVCGTGVVVILVKRERDRSQCVGQTLW